MPENRFTPPPHEAAKPSDPTFWFGSDALYVHLSADGRWRGKSDHLSWVTWVD